MSGANGPEHKARWDGNVARGAGMNLLGTGGKLLFPLYWIVVTRLFGPTDMGLFLLGYATLEIIGNLTVGGINDGVLMLASRCVDNDERRQEFYRIVANGFVATFGISAALIMVGHWVGPDLVSRAYSKANIWPVLEILLYTLPLTGFTTVVVSATKSLMIMRWEAILVSTLRPALMIAVTLGYFFTGGRGAAALAWSYLLACVLIGVLAAIVFSRHFSYRLLFAQFAHFRLSWPLMQFAIPQNINMTFHQFITQVDVVMLGLFQLPAATIGFYGMGAQIVGNLSKIQSAFSGAFAPVIARLHISGDVAGLTRGYATVSRWAATVVIPVTLVVLFLRSELLQLFHSTFISSSVFMLILALRPVFNSAFGISGNIIVMTGHATWNLINSVAVAGLNILLNVLLIPRWGLLGAATATVVSSLTVTALQLVELRVLIGAGVTLRKIYKPFLAALPGLVALVVLSAYTSSFVVRLCACAAVLVVYLTVLFGLGIEDADRETLFGWWTRRRTVH